MHKLSPILCTPIKPQQSLFLLGRRTTNNILTTHGIIEYINRHTKRRKNFMVIKIDLEKAFDCLEWNFL